MTINTESYEERRARAWYHKQHLDNLPTFGIKLKYWLESIGSFPHNTEYLDGDDTPFTLGINPETDNDRCELHRAWMEYYRKEKIDERIPIYKSNWQWSEVDKEKVAFIVRSLEALKSDLDERLKKSVRKVDLLKAELSNTTTLIDAVSSTINDYKEINELRYSLETKRPYDFTFVNEIQPVDKAIRLAEVWDVVHYEADLKDRLAILQNQSSQIKSDVSAITQSPTSIVEPEKSLLTHAQISLIHIYEVKPISKTNAKEIALAYGHEKPNAGKVLLRKYDELNGSSINRRNRKNIEEDITAILNRLTEVALQRAKNELDTIKNKRH